MRDKEKKYNTAGGGDAYRGLSKDEVYLLSRAGYEKQKLITGKFVKKLFKNPGKAYNVLSQLTKKGRLLQIERGKYFIVPIEAPKQLWAPNEFVTAGFWIGEVTYYIGYFTMYNYWGFVEQIPRTVYVLNTKKSKTKIIAGTKYRAVKISPDKYYGVKKVKIEGERVKISDKERTLVDLIDNPPGSFNIMKKIVEENLNGINREKFIDYLLRYPVKAVRKRAGYIMDKAGFGGKELEKLQCNIGNKNTYVVLNPEYQERKGKTNKDWRLIINE